jgi:hypothetical protein
MEQAFVALFFYIHQVKKETNTWTCNNETTKELKNKEIPLLGLDSNELYLYHGSFARYREWEVH